jgi:hypothetical protein
MDNLVEAMKISWSPDVRNLLHVDYISRVPSWDYYIKRHEVACNLTCERAQAGEIVSMVHTPRRIAMPAGNPLEYLYKGYLLLPKGVICYMVVENAFARMAIGLIATKLEQNKVGLGQIQFAASLGQAIKGHKGRKNEYFSVE